MSYILIVILIALQAADYQTTKLIFAGGGREANPIVAWLINRLGYEWGIITVKGAVAVVVIVVAIVVADTVWWWPWALMALIVGYIAVVAHNVRVIRELAK